MAEAKEVSWGEKRDAPPNREIKSMERSKDSNAREYLVTAGISQKRVVIIYQIIWRNSSLFVDILREKVIIIIDVL